MVLGRSALRPGEARRAFLEERGLAFRVVRGGTELALGDGLRFEDGLAIARPGVASSNPLSRHTGYGTRSFSARARIRSAGAQKYGKIE